MCGRWLLETQATLETSLRLVIAFFANLGDLDEILQLGIIIGGVTGGRMSPAPPFISGGAWPPIFLPKYHKFK